MSLLQKHFLFGDLCATWCLAKGSGSHEERRRQRTHQGQPKWQLTRRLLPRGRGCTAAHPCAPHTFAGRGPAWSHSPLNASYWQKTSLLQWPSNNIIIIISVIAIIIIRLLTANQAEGIAKGSLAPDETRGKDDLSRSVDVCSTHPSGYQIENRKTWIKLMISIDQ